MKGVANEGGLCSSAAGAAHAMESLSLQTRPRQSSALENWHPCRPSLKLQRISLGGIGTKTKTTRATLGQASFDRPPFSSTGMKLMRCLTHPRRRSSQQHWQPIRSTAPSSAHPRGRIRQMSALSVRRP